MCSPHHQPEGPQVGASRRSLLMGAGLVGAGVAVAGLGGAPRAAAAGRGDWRPDTEDQRDEYGGKIDQILHGTVGDVRVTERALRTAEFMTAR